MPFTTREIENPDPVTRVVAASAATTRVTGSGFSISRVVKGMARACVYARESRRARKRKRSNLGIRGTEPSPSEPEVCRGTYRLSLLRRHRLIQLRLAVSSKYAHGMIRGAK